ncbi:MAG: peptidylprolyl isomerase [Flavobacteriales bacterium]
MKRFFFTCIFSIFIGIIGHTQNDTEAVIMTLENEDITLGDFEYIFRKNNNEEITTQAALDEYIELFVNYKLKVKAAKDAKLDTNKAFIAELKGYRKQLARPYLTDSDLLNKLTKQAYDRKQTEVKAKHILVQVVLDAEPADTLIAWNKINTLRDRVTSGGEDFETVAKGSEGSEDPSVKDNGGDLGFFSAFQMVYPFEEAAYNTEPGNISQILRTRYGYHILKVEETRPARGKVLVAHIMTKAGNQSHEATKKRAEEKINEIYQKYVNGEEFGELSRKYSEDATTSKQGGKLPWFGTRKMVKSFEDVAFNLKDSGSVSLPFQTEYGWHIIQKLDEKVIGDFDQLKAEIKTKVSKDSRAEKTKKSFLNKLKKEYAICTKEKSLKHIYQSVDSSFFTNNWEMKKPKKLKKRVLTIEDKKFTLADFNTYMTIKKRRANTDVAEIFIKSTYSDWVDDELLAHEDSKLEMKHKPFRQLMQEYRDGILLFELTDELVWSKAIKDTTGLEQFYQSNKANYTWPDRFDVTAYSTNSASISTEIIRLLSNQVEKDSILAIINDSSELNANYESGIFSVDEKAYLENIDATEDEITVVESEGKFYVINLIQFIPSKEKELKEAKGIITSDFQGHLEKRWIDELRSTYNYTVHKNVLYSIAND